MQKNANTSKVFKNSESHLGNEDKTLLGFHAVRNEQSQCYMNF